MHCECKSHLEQAKSLKSQPRLCFASQAQNDAKKIEAELHMTVLTASSNVPLSFHDLRLPMIRKVFPDSKIAAKYQSASTKAMCMLNEAVALTLLHDLIQSMKTNAFSLCVDGSNDSGLEKMNPVAIRLYDVNQNKIVTCFLDMCTSRSSTAKESIVQ